MTLIVGLKGGDELVFASDTLGYEGVRFPTSTQGFRPLTMLSPLRG